MTDRLAKVRVEMRSAIKEFAKPRNKNVSEEQAMKDEAAFAASNLANGNPAQRMKAVEFLELLAGNPFAQDHLLKALDDKDTAVVQKVILAMGKVGSAAAIPKLKEFIARTKAKQLAAEVSKLILKLEKKQP